MRFIPVFALISGLFASPALAGDPLPEALLAQHSAQSACDPLEQLPIRGDGEAHELPGGGVLYLVPCFAGAYNFGWRFYVDRDNAGRYEVLYFADYSARWGWTGTDVLYLPTFDPETLMLTSFYKGRGLGDCGTAGRWAWDEYLFRLVEYRAKDDCDGTGGPGDFPVVYP